MSIVSARFFSETLGKQAELKAIIPDQGAGPFPVLYLLHGGSDDCSNWTRFSRIECHAAGLPLIVVMPDGYYGFFVDNHAGPAYARYMLKDVFGFVERTFHARTDYASRAIGGLSMGGYGALYLALANPKLFASAHSHSGCFGYWGEHLKHWGMEFTPEYLAMLQRIHGPNQDGSDHDLFALATRVKRSRVRIPKLLLDCGTSDSLLQTNRDYHAHLTNIKIPHRYDEYPGGHTWDYWDAHIRHALEFHCRALGMKETRP